MHAAGGVKTRDGYLAEFGTSAKSCTRVAASRYASHHILPVTNTGMHPLFFSQALSGVASLKLLTAPHMIYCAIERPIFEKCSLPGICCGSRARQYLTA
jgi:hypothetical protein